MNNFIEHVVTLTTQADADAIVSIPLDVNHHPMTLESVLVYISAVGSTPTAITLDLNITDGTASQVPIAAQSIGTAAGQTRLVPTAAIKAEGDHIVAQDDDNNWRYNFDLNFTGGTSPTITGTLVFRWAH